MRRHLHLALVSALALACTRQDGVRTKRPPEDAPPATRPEPRTPAFVPWPDLDAPAATAVLGGDEDAAVIVALESYPFIPPVPGAIANGLAWQRYFTDTLGISPTRIKLLTAPAATHDEIGTAIDWAAKQARSGGRVWFVFIGHGAPSHSARDGLLLGADAQGTLDSIEARSLRHSEIIARLETSAAQPIVVLDACYSGQTASEQALCVGCQPIKLADVPKPQRAIVLSAAKSDQVAGPLPGRAQPAFSYLVLGSLRGWADADGDGTVIANEVITYVNGTMAAVVHGRTQTPELLGDGTAPLAKSTGERGPDLAEIQRALARGGEVRINGDGIVLAELPPLTLRDIDRDELLGAAGLSNIDMAKERELEERWLTLQEAKRLLEQTRTAARSDPSGAKQEKVWCGLAALGDPNPYREEATKACAQARTYVEQRKRLVMAMQRDWYEKVVPFVDLQHRSIADKHEVVRAFVNAYDMLAERPELRHALDARRQLGNEILPRLIASSRRILIPGGSFDGHEVADFYLDKTEVTVAAYGACVEADGCATPLRYHGECNWGRNGRDSYPMNCLSTYDADEFCEWAGARLPTTWEWEWAARGRDRDWVHPWGDENPDGRACLGEHGTCVVGSYPSGASIDGVLDLAGNVWEWTSTTEGSERVVRGGSAGTREVYESTVLAYDKVSASQDRYSSIGFRCARTK